MDIVSKALNKLNNALEVLVNVVAATIAGVMVTALTASAVTRYVSGTGYDWLIELPPALVPWLVFPMLGPLLRNGAHIKVDILPAILNQKNTKILNVFVYATTLIGAVMFLLAGNEAVKLFRQLGQLMELEIEIPIWWMYLAFPTGFAILASFSVELLINAIKELKSK